MSAEQVKEFLEKWSKRMSLARTARFSKILINGITELQRQRRGKFGEPLILNGREGVILRDLLIELADSPPYEFVDDETFSSFQFACSVFFHRSPVICEDELSTRHNTWCMKG